MIMGVNVYLFYLYCLLHVQYSVFVTSPYPIAANDV